MIAEPKQDLHIIPDGNIHSFNGNSRKQIKTQENYPEPNAQENKQKTIQQQEDEIDNEEEDFYNGKLIQAKSGQSQSIEDVDVTNGIKSIIVKDRAKLMKVALKMSAKRSRIKEQNQAQKQETIQWNGINLIKNNLCQEQYFFCGNFQTYFANVGDYAKHCLDECQVISHKKSSHFIAIRQKDNKFNQSNQAMNVKTSIMSKQKQDIEAYPQMVWFCHQGLQYTINDIKPLKNIINGRRDHRNLPFYCGQCKINFNSKINYHSDILRKHKKVVQPTSSHIILHCRTRKNHRTQLIYLSPQEQWSIKKAIYFCPCNPHDKITMATLIYHVLHIHKGVSLIYYLSYNYPLPNEEKYMEGNKKESKKTYVADELILFQEEMPIIPDTHSCLKINNVEDEKLNYDIFKRIYKYSQDHREIPFYCGQCKIDILFDGYLIHMTNEHQSYIHPSISHIVLKVLQEIGNKQLYISPNMEWIDYLSWYFCPCMQQNKIKMNQLIKHIIQDHKGISPEYKISKRSQIQAFQEEIIRDRCLENILIKDYKDPFLIALVKAYSLHKTLPF